MNRIQQMIDTVSPQTAHAVGATSGATGIFFLVERATTLFGCIAAFGAAVGGVAYGIYWVVKAVRKINREGE